MRLCATDLAAVLGGLLLFMVAMAVWSWSSGDVKYPSNDP